MLSPKSELFVKEVLSYIKFVFDRKDIRKELEAHISDKMDYYSEPYEDMMQRTIKYLKVSTKLWTDN